MPPSSFSVPIHRVDAGVGHCDICGDWTPWGYDLKLGRNEQRLAFVCRSCEDCVPAEVHIQIKRKGL